MISSNMVPVNTAFIRINARYQDPGDLPVSYSLTGVREIPLARIPANTQHIPWVCSFRHHVPGIVYQKAG
jgi:hypothetical protein